MGAVSTSKRSSAGKNVLVFFIVFMILEMLIIFGVGKVFKNKDVTPSVLGYSLFMTNEDLLKTENGVTTVVVPKNVLVIASNGVSEPKNNISKAILCENVESEGTGVYWLANVVEKEKGKDGVDFIVANGGKDYRIDKSDAIGVCASYFVTAGKVINFITQKFGMICCAVVPLFLLVLIELIIAIATHSPEEDEEEEDEDEGEKNVQLDDFLFGGKNESEQIAKRRKKPVSEDDEEEDDEDISVRKAVKPAHNDDFDFDIGVRKTTKAPTTIPDIQAFPAQPAKQPAAEADFDSREFFGVQPNNAGAPAPQQDNSSLRLKDDEYYEKASQLVEGSESQSRPARRPAGQRPRRRRPVSSSNGADNGASLEDLMKLMEEEQNKLKGRMK
ncbi:MAG: hypothetical protein E7494_10685 [Ruminococcus albus]|jgi:pyruvate/2-oxoglutarate dehydrogenase complex dihydrolipoamide acyltransferase (E2) component|nr:hypothetical protein [Ruminococcus albus]